LAARSALSKGGGTGKLPMNTITHATRGPGDNDVAVCGELVRALFASVAVPLMNLVVVAISAVVFWPVYPAWIILAWTGAAIAVAAFRLALWLRFKRRQQDAGALGSWAFAFTLASATMGCVWGLLASTVFVGADMVYTVFAAFVLGGVSAGAATHSSPHLPAYYGFTAPAVLPLVVALLTRGAAMPMGMGLMLLAFVAMLTVVARDNNRRLVEYIRMKIEQGVLNDDLQKVALDLTREVAERRQIAAALEESGERFSAIGKHALNPIIISGPHGEVVYWNTAAERIFGYTADEMEGRSIHNILAPERYREKAQERYAHFVRTGEGDVLGKTVALDALRKDGTEFPIELSVSAMNLGGVRHALGIARDVTEQRRTEEKVARLNDQLAATVVVLRRREHDQTEIAKLSDLLQSCATTTEAYPIVAAAAISLFPNANGALARTEKGTHDLTRVAAWGADQVMMTDFLIEDCWALRTGQRREVERPESAAQCRHFSQAPRGPYICMPLIVQGETSGLLYFGLDEGGVIDDELRQTAQSFGDVVKLSLVNIQQRELLGQQAIRDHLTGLFNRRYLVETLPREVRRVRRRGSPLTIAMLDIDFFKKFNDEYGHDAGDKVLSELGLVLKQGLREEDIACRYGGEEFVVVLLECDLATARERLSQICLLVKGKAPVFRGRTLPNITLSVGMATLSDALPSAESLITAADNAMYLAKSNGRDRIEEFQTPGAGGPAKASATEASAPAKADEAA
jgi:diguanylate cyclase (GGDEF)-like protein/PAS domain S-box-containing protein